MSGMELAIKKAEAALQHSASANQNAHIAPTHEWALNATRREQELMDALGLLLDEVTRRQIPLVYIQHAQNALSEWERDDLPEWELAGNALSNALRFFLAKAVK